MYTFNSEQYDNMYDVLDMAMAEMDECSEIRAGYNKMLNENSTVDINGSLYDASYILEELDFVSYNIGLSEYIDDYCEEMKELRECEILRELTRLGFDIEETEDVE